MSQHSRLIRWQAPVDTDRNNVAQAHSTFYKDEGGQAKTYDFELNLLRAEREVSVGARLWCVKCKGKQPEIFVSPNLFRVERCTAVQTKKGVCVGNPHVLNVGKGTGDWEKHENVQTFCAEEKCVAVRVHCKFNAVSRSFCCKSCGAKTRFSVQLHTDKRRSAQLKPVLVMSKRKIPVVMREKSTKEIEAFKSQKREERKRKAPWKSKFNLKVYDSPNGAPRKTAQQADNMMQLMLENERLLQDNCALREENVGLKRHCNELRTTHQAAMDNIVVNHEALAQKVQSLMQIKQHDNMCDVIEQDMYNPSRPTLGDIFDMDDEKLVPLNMFATLDDIDPPLTPLADVTEDDLNFVE